MRADAWNSDPRSRPQPIPLAVWMAYGMTPIGRSIHPAHIRYEDNWQRRPWGFSVVDDNGIRWIVDGNRVVLAGLECGGPDAYSVFHED